MIKRITLLPGDGIGPEVINQAVKVLFALEEKSDWRFQFCYADLGAEAIDKWGDPLPPETLEACVNADAILLGAVGHPKYDGSADYRPEEGLLKLRKNLELYSNIMPVRSYPSLFHLSPLRPHKLENVDFIIYRELTGGIYFGEKGYTNESMEEAFDKCIYSRGEIERIAHLAFRKAGQRRKKVTLVDMANVLETSRLWRKTVREIHAQYPGIELNFLYADNATMQLILDPAQFDIILTSNMFGDILTGQASVLFGSTGLLPSASVGESSGLFEAVQGSYSQVAGLDKANPIGAVLSAAMMLDYLDLEREAHRIRRAVDLIIEQGIVTEDLNPGDCYSCSYIGDILATVVEEEYAAKRLEKIAQNSMNTII